MKNTRVPTKITLDAYAASHRAVREMKEDGELPVRVKVRSSQYLNNLVEQDHRRVKQRIRPMLGFKRFDNAVVTISGIELAEKVKKGQFKTGKLGGCYAAMTELWNAALAAWAQFAITYKAELNRSLRQLELAPEPPKDPVRPRPAKRRYCERFSTLGAGNSYPAAARRSPPLRPPLR